LKLVLSLQHILPQIFIESESVGGFEQLAMQDLRGGMTIADCLKTVDIRVTGQCQ